MVFITEEKFKDMSYEDFNQALEAVHNKAIEATLCLLPDVILGLIVKTKAVNSSLEQFKKDFPEFAKREEDLARTIQEIEFENPNWTLDQILKEVPNRIDDIDHVDNIKQPQNLGELERIANGFL